MRLLVRMTELLSFSLWSLARLRISPREVLRQFYEAGNRSILFVTVTMAFIGMIGVYQIASTMARVLPEYSTLGAAVLQGLTRELGPLMAGLLLATRVGTGMAAEIGSMKVTDQLEALKLTAVDPVELLVLPRLVAATFAGLALAALGTVVAYFAGLAVAWLGFSVLPDTFLSLRFVRESDLAIGIVKSLLFGFTVPLISCACGFEADEGSEGVGEATTRAVVLSSFAVILLDAFVTYGAEVILR
jgi:phospholipid/cholesterol/gamma-HCH transport system permease protein